MKNEKGYVIVAALFILAILTIMGTLSLHISITERQISANHYVHTKNFYAADSSPALGVNWLKANLTEDDFKNVDWFADFDFPIGNINEVNVYIEHQTAVDPSDGIEKVLLYGDSDGDYLDEVNFTNGVPFEIILGTGTCTTRGGKAIVETRWRWQTMFIMPDAALHVNSNVNGNGVSGSIIGEHKAGSSCVDVADIRYEIVGGTIEYAGSLGETPVVEKSPGMYPMALIEPFIRKKADIVIPGSNNIDEKSIVSSVDDPQIVYVDGDGKITNLTGYGILFVNGTFEFSGNLDWNGLILVNGDIILSGGGTKTIDGAVIAAGDANAINGSVDIQYDCDYLNSDYKLLTWRQL